MYRKNRGGVHLIPRVLDWGRSLSIELDVGDSSQEDIYSFLEFVAKSGQNFIKNSQEKNKIWRKNWKIGNSFIHSRKNVDDFWLKFWDLSGAKVCKFCRSRQEFSNEYLLAKIGVDDDDDDDDESLPVIVSIWPCTYWRAGSGVLRELFQSPRPCSASWRLGDSVPIY